MTAPVTLSVIPTKVGIHCAELPCVFLTKVAVVDPDVRRDDSSYFGPARPANPEVSPEPLTTLNFLNLTTLKILKSLTFRGRNARARNRPPHRLTAAATHGTLAAIGDTT